ncbi:conserved hypothetical protein [Lasallia pustulata]|uniref:WD40/YVTN repeat-like-containing domain n=1 Tax=Lasallia pustulata TaxID=136370 RepID=A0A1W5D0B1_9LECA|nr:conserved hypothetical protein [Lasallia pustulata]
MKPNLRRIDGTRIIQLSYELPHRIHTTNVYPIAAPNGSTIVLYGYEHGLRILWRGGRPLKKALKKKEEKPKANGISNDVVMIIDSDDEQPPSRPAQPYQDEPEFEDEEDEYDSTEPYQTIVQTLDLLLGTEVLHMAVPQLPPDLDPTTGSVPSILSQKVVIAAACSDCSIRLITLPLCPPSPASKARSELRNNVSLGNAGNGMWGDKMVVIPSNIGHQSIPCSVSITFSPQDTGDAVMDDSEVEGEPEARARSTLRAPSRGRSRSRSQQAGNGEWDLLVASHSSELSGVLLIYRLPISVDRHGSSTLSAEHIVPWRTKHLPSPAASISFSSSLYPSKRHMRLLVAETRGAVRVYEPLATPSASDGEWQVSLYPGFENSLIGVPKRKSIIDSRWVLGGKAIIVLLTDGEWGIWDPENAGPKAKDQLGQSRSSSKSSPTDFAIGDWMELATASTLPKSSSGKTDSKSRLAPMTPHTRKVRQEALFSGSTSLSSTLAVQGGITIIPAGGHFSNRRADDETILLWYGGNIITIPSLITHWQDKVTGSGNLFGTGAMGQVKEISNVNLGGELRNGVTIIPRHLGKRDTATAAADPLPDIIVTGETRLLIIAAPLPEPKQTNTFAQAEQPAAADQRLLARGELDVGGMERILASMANGIANPIGWRRSRHSTKGTAAKRRAGFSTTR